MYRHLLVPTDGSPLSIEAVGNAVDFARTAGARVTFFYAKPNYSASIYGEAALLRSVVPEEYFERYEWRTRAILAKAEAAARAVGVAYDSVSTESDSPHEAIIAAAEQSRCDLIFMASHGRSNVVKLMLGSETLKVLMHSPIAVLVSSPAKASPSLNRAIALIEDEHRSLAAVLHGLQYHLDQVRTKQAELDAKLIEAMLYYIREFPERSHHPKEDEYLFPKVRKRGPEFDAELSELQRQHAHDPLLIRAMGKAFARWKSNEDGALEGFSRAVEEFAAHSWAHMALEENVILPAARKCLTTQDWTEIEAAFEQNADPRFGSALDAQFRNLFARIVNLVPHPEAATRS